jgi:5-deoxy-glucuronate isomerase
VKTHIYFQSIQSSRGEKKIENNPCSLLDFSHLVLLKNEVYSNISDSDERVIVVLGGACYAQVGGKDFGRIGGRENVFAGKPYALYVPPRHKVSLIGSSDICELAICWASAEIETDGFVIKPADVVEKTTGTSNFTRKMHGILVGDTRAVQRLIVGETYTPSGNWSTYPPHKHEKDNLPEEVYMEEIYYFKVNPPQGFGIAKYFTDDEAIDEIYTIRNSTVLMMPRGYHTVVSAPGYVTYYLWCLAGNCRAQAVASHPDQAWVNKYVDQIEHYVVQLGKE